MIQINYLNFLYCTDEFLQSHEKKMNIIFNNVFPATSRIKNADRLLNEILRTLHKKEWYVLITNGRLYICYDCYNNLWISEDISDIDLRGPAFLEAFIQLAAKAMGLH